MAVAIHQAEDPVDELTNDLGDMALDFLWRYKIQDAIVEKRAKEVEITFARLNTAKDSYTTAKEAYAGELYRLRGLDRAAEEDLPLFDQKGSSDPATASDDDSRLNLSVDRLRLASGVLEALHEAGLDTIRDIRNWAGKDRLFRDIPGIGAARAEKLEEALVTFWEEHPADES